MDLQILKDNPWLDPWRGGLEQRQRDYQAAMKRIEDIAGSLDKFTLSYKEFGVHKVEGGILYREWAPNAKEIYLCGDFNNWNGEDPNTKCKDEGYGHFSVFLKDTPDGPVIKHDTKIKCRLVLKDGSAVWRIPAWINYTRQNTTDVQFNGIFWNPPEPYVWKHPVPEKDDGCALLIYETHIGMAGVEPRIHTYAEFEKNVLPMIKKDGYNAIQIMAIMEHPYYGSFGYQVTNFFAISSRFGTPEELKSMIDAAHGMGIRVFLDLVHSHACKNVDEGINHFDGTDHQYFHEGGRGYHPLWDSRCFNYNHPEVQRFLLSNLRYYLDEYHFDGFRFDGVTSMMYLHHGNLYSFTSIDDYFNSLVDREAITYLMLANTVVHQVRKDAITIAEDVSGMVGLARTIEDGGIGFDYRLGMASPDMWIKMLKEQTDEQWDMGNVCHTLSNRPYKEKTVAYCESHDQALVGDKTIAFWLMDKDMYTDMSCLTPPNMVISRGMALHKLIRLITIGLGGEAYLNFMGNEFGHPEWIDFPREGNGNSFLHCCRRFDLPFTDHLRYKYLLAFDNAMINLEHAERFLESPHNYITLKHEEDKVIAFEKGELLWVFNFHTQKSFENYPIGVEWEGKYKVILSSDDEEFGGYNRIDKNTEHFAFKEPYQCRQCKIMLYIPCRTAQVLKRV